MLGPFGARLPHLDRGDGYGESTAGQVEETRSGAAGADVDADDELMRMRRRSFNHRLRRLHRFQNVLNVIDVI